MGSIPTGGTYLAGADVGRTRGRGRDTFSTGSAAGRDFRLTDVYGEVVKGILA